MPVRAPLPSEVSDPIVTIDTSKMILALEEGLEKIMSASKVPPSVASCESGLHDSGVRNTILNNQAHYGPRRKEMSFARALGILAGDSMSPM